MNTRRIAGCALFLVAFGFYLHGAYPSVSVGDSGEFITTGNTLGVPHAPGYPTYVVLAKIIATCLPWGNVGYRINVFSTLCGSFTIVLIFGLVCTLTTSLELGLFAALLLMSSHALMLNSQASEVFALHVLFCAGILWAALANRWLLAAFLLGLGMGNHQTLLFLLPALSIAYTARASVHRTPIYPVLFCALAGLSIYAFLYIRSTAHPGLNSGNPDSLYRFWRVFTRADYGSLTLALGTTPQPSVTNILLQLERFLRGLSDQVTWVGILLGLIGTVLWVRKDAVPALTIALAFIVIGPIFFVMGNLPFDAQSTGLLERFYIAPTFCWILLSAVGLVTVCEHRRWVSWIACLLPLSLLVQPARASFCRNDFRGYSYGMNNLRTVTLHALFIMDGGDDTFYTLAYLTQVEGKRSDVELHDRGGVVFPGLYGEDFRSLTHDEKDFRRQQVERALIVGGRSVTYSTMNEELLPGQPLLQEGILYQASVWSSHPPPPHGEKDMFWLLYDLRGIAPWQASSDQASSDYRTRALVPFYAYQRSVQLARSADWEDAIGFARAAQAQGPDVVWLIPNLEHGAHVWALQNFQSGRFDLAEQIYRMLLDWNPMDAFAWSNLGAIEERIGRVNEAMADYKKAIQADPGSANAHYNLAVAYWKQSRWHDVVEELTKVLSIDPNNAAARSYLAQAILKSQTTTQ